MNSDIFAGYLAVFAPNYLITIILGVAGGIAIGALPGLTAAMGVALLLPFTYGMDATSGMLMLVSIFVGAIYGGSITAILIRTPGTPASAATVLDGAVFADRGEGGRAIGISTFASCVGGLISVIVMMTVSPQLAKVALEFGPAEYFSLAIFGLTIISCISGNSLIRGLIIGVVGLVIATVGLDPMTGNARFTYGSIDLLNGIQLIPVLIGVFAVSNILISAENIDRETRRPQKVTKILPSWADLRQSLPISFMSGIIGTVIGIIPAAGCDIGAFVSYGTAKRLSKHPEKFGTGIVEGVAAPEAGNNGVTGGAMIPLLTLGVPGDATTSIMLGALMLKGLQPGPLLFRDNGLVVGSIFSGMFLANIFMLIIGLLCVNIFTKIVSVRSYVLIPTILLLCMLGSYAMNQNFFDVAVMLIAGGLGYLFVKLDFPPSPLVITMILGPMAESNIRRMLITHDGDVSFLFTRPIAVMLLILALISAAFPLIKKLLAKRPS